jgi:hypothetical protein
MFKKSSRVLLVTLLLFVLAGSSYAFAASNTVPPTNAGDGNGIISGYTVSNIVYSTSNGNLTSVSFTLSGNASVVQAAVVTGATPVACTGSGTTWSCSFTGVTVLAADLLRVVAVQ